MKVLVANLGSTSFKYRLFDMTDERQLARGGTERIGAEHSRSFVEIGSCSRENVVRVPDHAAAVERCLASLTDAEFGCLREVSEVAAIGWKAVHGGRISGVQRVTDTVLDAMEAMNGVAPAHNPPYVAAMRLLRERLPEIPLVAAFETGFHATIPPRQRRYAVPTEWAEVFHVQRWGFHGASHRYIGQRIGELVAAEETASSRPRLASDQLRVISCHLGGSSSLCAMRGGKSVATSLGMSPQSGVPHNNRVGDFDPFALPVIMHRTGKTLDEVLGDLAQRSGLLGLSGRSGDVRDLEVAAAAGDAAARLALDVFTTAVRHYLGGLMVELGGADVIVFTGGIGENAAAIRAAVCHGLHELGIVLDPEANQGASGETRIDGARSRIQIWVVPTNEEIVVARQTKQLLEETLR